MQMKTNEAIFDILLKDALISVYEKEISEVNIAEEHIYSERINKSIRRIGRKINSKTYTKTALKIIRKSIISVAAILGIVFGGLLTQPSVYAAVENVIREIFASHDRLTFANEDSNEVLNKDLRLGYIPYGYTIKSAFFGYNDVTLCYESNDEKEIMFQYGLSANFVISIDNDTHECEIFEQNGKNYYFYEAIDDDNNILLWYDKNYVYCISAQMPVDEIVHVAENVIR